MSFGYSIGDFVAGYNVTYRLVRILAESRGASIEYQEAMAELRAMEQVFLEAGNLVNSKLHSRDIKNGIACIVLSTVDIIDNFYERSRQYQQRLGERRSRHGKSAASLESSWCKVGWTLFKKEELRALKTQLHERLTSVHVLLGMASYPSNLPSNIAQYQETQGKGLHAEASCTSGEHVLELIDSRIEKKREAEDDASHPSGHDANVDEIAMVKASQNQLSTAPGDASETARLKSILESLEEKLTSISAREKAKELAEAKAKEVKQPINFKDAVGRKYSFPFERCTSWQGMEELIKLAFVQVDIIGPHVDAGHYDIFGPDGELILPPVWPSVIQPGWAITMRMWPMDSKPRLHRPRMIPRQPSGNQAPQEHPAPRGFGGTPGNQRPQGNQPPQGYQLMPAHRVPQNHHQQPYRPPLLPIPSRYPEPRSPSISSEATDSTEPQSPSVSSDASESEKYPQSSDMSPVSTSLELPKLQSESSKETGALPLTATTRLRAVSDSSGTKGDVSGQSTSGESEKGSLDIDAFRDEESPFDFIFEPRADAEFVDPRVENQLKGSPDSWYSCRSSNSADVM